MIQETNRSRIVRAALLAPLLVALMIAPLSAAEQQVRFLPQLFQDSKRFESYEPNYAVWQWTDGDENALEAHYSFRYHFFEDNSRSWFFAYTGEFDFYMFDTRPSSPVINRLSNPTFHYRRNLNRETAWNRMLIRWWDVGFEHLSNGQVIDADLIDEGSGRYVTELAWDEGRHEYFDTLSRGTNFVSAEVLLKTGSSQDILRGGDGLWSLSLSLKARVYVSEASDITWGPLAGRNVQISDYHRFQVGLTKSIRFEKIVFRDLELGLQYVFGDRGVDTDSLDFSLLTGLEFWGIRLPVYYLMHRGPNDIFANYTQERNSHAVGFLLR